MLAFLGDGRLGAVAGEDAGFVGEGEEAGVDGMEEGADVAAGEVGAADRVGEEGVSGEEELVLGKVEAEGAGRVSGGEEDGSGEAGAAELRGGADDDAAPVGGAEVGRGDVGGGNAEPAGLEVHHADEREVELVVEDGRAGEGLEMFGAGDVIDVGVGDDDLFDGEGVLGEHGEDAAEVRAGVDDDGLLGGFVAEDGAVALERADGEDFVDHGIMVGNATAGPSTGAL